VFPEASEILATDAIHRNRRRAFGFEISCQRTLSRCAITAVIAIAELNGVILEFWRRGRDSESKGESAALRFDSLGQLDVDNVEPGQMRWTNGQI